MNHSVGHIIEQLRPLALAMSERHEKTADHNVRTCTLALALGASCGLAARDLELLHAVALVHDIGKIGIPDTILLSPARLDADEWEIMKSHSERGYRILSSIEAEDAAAIATAVRHHHESFDGSGYPDGLAGEDIPVLSRIVALVDCYDALAETRPYHAPKSHQTIVKILHEENGAKYDPHLREKFVHWIENSAHRARAES
jgi:HD-GYP domain-containing protein (c-di-GMP phosphodiesterase class II)